MLDGDAVAFRHELARLVIEDGLTPTRRTELHRRTLAALAASPTGERDPARLAHHAEAAGDTGAVLQYAPAAAEQAFEVGAFREAAAQYARALRFATDRPPGERAALLEGRSRACYLADDQVEAIAVITEAIALRETEGALAPRARALSELTSYLFCRGLYSQAEAAVAEAERNVAVAEGDSGHCQCVALPCATDLRRRRRRRRRARSRGRGHRSPTWRPRDGRRGSGYYRIP